MATGNFIKSDLYVLHNYIQNSMISYPKELFIETLRDHFSEDSYYRYQRDAWGFPINPDHTNIPLDTLHNNNVSRLFIGEYFKQGAIYYPALLIKANSFKSTPISMSRNKGTVKYESIKYIDGYGREKIISTPAYFVQTGAWEGSMSVDIETRSSRARDELTDLVSIMFHDTRFDELKDAGVLIKSVSAGSPTESEDRNDKLFKCSISFDIRSEWRRHIPVRSIIDAINISIDIGDLTKTPAEISPNLKINTNVEFIEALYNI